MKQMLLRKYHISSHPVLLHIIAWSVFVAYELSLVRVVRVMQGLQDSILTDYALPYLVNIGLFYFHALYTTERCFSSKPHRVLLFIVLLCLELGCYLFLMGLIDSRLSSLKNDFWNALYPSKIIFIKQLWRGIYFLIFSTAFWLIRKTFKKERRLKEAETKVLQEEKEKKELQLQLMTSQNAFLRAQINPHLLFNTLNFIHSEVQQTAPQASEAIITLSDMMRYSLTDARADGKVSVEEEIEQIENMIRINQFRFDQQLFIDLKARGDFDNARIVPLLLLPFVENLFKYAVLTEEKQPAQIRIEMKNGTLDFFTHNRKRRSRTFPSLGIGIQNVKTRLEANYPGRHLLCIEEEHDFYIVHLTIEL